MIKKQAKDKITKLISRYKELSPSDIKQYNEQQTKDHFIRPFFEALGWDFEEDVWSEIEVHGKRADYAFKLNGIPRFYVEAKPLKADLDDQKFANQAINYAWNKGVNWAVLTDFESLKLYNALAETKRLFDKLVFEISYDQFLADFDRLWLLSKESFNNNALDEYAIKHAKKLKKLTVNEKLFKDLTKAREMLTRSMERWNKGLDQEILEEGVQKILDRLVFIRVLEDRVLEPPLLKPLIREWEAKRMKDQFLKLLTKKFSELYKIYDSSLFDKHACDEWEEHDGEIQKVINMLYGTSMFQYDFKEIPADILGGVYEHYLGYISRESAKEKIRRKRKEKGIYYTPKFIVDYIIKNTLDVQLKEIKSVNEIKKLKVLDPACGSGSFLTTALRTINTRYKDFNYPGDQNTKTMILKENIHGVDLDPKAIELAKLNLLIEALDRKAELPDLTTNLKVGNSLVSGEEQELKKYFGKDWKEEKSFNWEEEFKDVFKHGGFDVIIGNPPWGAYINESEKEYLRDKYESAEGIIDTFVLFIEKSTKLLKGHGYLGFILPDIILLKNYPKIRKFILDNYIIENIYYTGRAFKEVNLDTVIMILKKAKNNLERKKNIINIQIDNKIKQLEQKLFFETEGYNFNIYLDKKKLNLKKTLDSISYKLGDLLEIHEGIHSGNIRDKLFLNEPTTANCKKLLFKGPEVNRYYKKWEGKYVNYNKKIINKDKKEYANLGKEEYFINDKILLRRTGDKLIAILDKENYFASNNFFVLYFYNDKDGKQKIDLKYILAILNSPIATWYFTTIQPRRGRLFAEVKIKHLNEIPIYKIDFSNLEEKSSYDNILRLVDKILFLNKSLDSISENSTKWISVKGEIKKLDQYINQEIYKLYNLTEKEIKLVEKNELSN